jgi:hypothetical protein
MYSSVIFVAACAGSAAAVDSSTESAFEAFVAKYGKVYASLEERAARFEVFAANFALVEAENAKGKSYKLAINEFADVPIEEFRGQRLGYSPAEHQKTLRLGSPFLGTDLYSGEELPESVDWVQDGAVTPVKDQGSCGSCWTFSTSGSLEGAWKIATGNLVSVSEQQLIDCAKAGGLDGCNGGEMDPAFTYLENRDVCAEDGYPYLKKAGNTCSEESCTVAIPRGSVVGFKDVPAGDTKALMEAVAQQPVSTAVQAGQSAFQMYKEGVLTSDCTANVDHAVLIVGYGTDNGVDYWKIKNSWGANWGEEGFIRLARGVAGDGECGVKVMPSYPVMRAPETIV